MRKLIPCVIFIIIIIFISIITLANLVYAEEHICNKLIGMKIDDIITKATVQHMRDALTQAEESYSPLLIIINTPGGSLDSTLEIVEMILNSKIPVIVYVYPIGAKAWSAGSFILLSADIAAMAPGTVMGSA